MLYLSNQLNKTMKNLFILFIISIFLYSCGNNPVTTNNPPPVTNDSLIYSLDSLRCDNTSLHDTTNGIYSKYIFATIDSVPKIRITFDLTTNDTNAIVYVAIKQDSTNYYADTSYFAHIVNGSYNFIWNITHTLYLAALQITDISINNYAVIRKLKIYKIN